MIKQAPALNPEYRTHLRLAEQGDAAYICELRNSLATYLNAPPSTPAQQANWLEHYKDRERMGAEFYFVIVSEALDRGVIRMYDFHTEPSDRSFSWGSWIIAPPRANGIVTFTAITMYELGFDVLGFDFCRFDVSKGNTGVRDFHLRTGATLISEDEVSDHFVFTPAAYLAFRARSHSQILAHREKHLRAHK